MQSSSRDFREEFTRSELDRLIERFICLYTREPAEEWKHSTDEMMAVLQEAQEANRLRGEVERLRADCERKNRKGIEDIMAVADANKEVDRLRTPFDLDLEANQAALAVYEGDLLGLCNSTLFGGKVSERVCAALWERQERLRSKAEKYDKLVEVASSMPSIQTDPSPSHWAGDYERLRKKAELADECYAALKRNKRNNQSEVDWLRRYEEVT